LADHADRPDLVDQQLPDFLGDLDPARFRLADGGAEQLEAFQKLRIFMVFAVV
jgi:hypothetical protein